MKADHTVKQGDIGTTLPSTLRDGAGNPVNLQGAQVRFKMGRAKAAPEVDAVANIVQVGDGSDGSKGKVSYTWAAGDIDTPGLYRAEFEVAFASGAVQSFPDGSYIALRVLADVRAPA